MKRITIQGIAGCFHETAAHGSFPGEEVEVLPCVSFDEQFARMAADAELLGVAAIENTIAGSLLPNHELLRRSTLTVIGEYKLRISHVLAALPGQQIADIREVHSHPIALMQCGEYLKARPAMKVVERDDTAGSAREIASQRLAGTAAICGAEAAELYGLEILERGIETNKHNFTRFLVLADRSRAAEFTDPARTDKASLVFTLPHAQGEPLESADAVILLRNQPHENTVAADHRTRMGIPVLRGRHLRRPGAVPAGGRCGPAADQRLPDSGQIRRISQSRNLNRRT